MKAECSHLRGCQANAAKCALGDIWRSAAHGPEGSYPLWLAAPGIPQHHMCQHEGARKPKGEAANPHAPAPLPDHLPEPSADGLEEVQTPPSQHETGGPALLRREQRVPEGDWPGPSG